MTTNQDNGQSNDYADNYTDRQDAWNARSQEIADCEDCAEMPGEECCPKHS